MRRFLARLGRALTSPFVDDVRSAALLSVAACGTLTVALLVAGRDLTDLWFGTSLPARPLKWTMLAVLSPSAAILARAPSSRSWFRRGARFIVFAGGALAFVDASACVRDHASGRLHGLAPVTLSLAFAIVLVASALLPSPTRVHQRTRWLRPALVAVFACGWAALDIASVAFTDYRRHASAIVVLGAGVRSDGAPSEALAQRMATACELYREGYAPLLIVSGGQAPGRESEPEVMRRVALRCGVPFEDIVLDEHGDDTEATAVNVAAISRAREEHLGLGGIIRTTLVVSHGYHLARARLAMDRAGVVAYTVPAEETRRLPAKPWYLVRELGAFIVYAVAMPTQTVADDCG